MKKDKKGPIQFQEKWLVPFFVTVLEVIFHVAVFGTFDGYIVYGILFSFPFSFFVLLVSSTGNRIWNCFIRAFFLFLMLIYFVAQLMYHQVFGNFLSLKSVANGAGQVIDFLPSVMQTLKECAPVIIGMICLWLAFVGVSCLFYEKGKKKGLAIINKERLAYLTGMFLIPFVGTIILMAEGTEIHSAFDTKINFYRTEQSMYKLGLMETLKKDVVENVCDRVGMSEEQWNRGYLWMAERLFRGNEKTSNAVLSNNLKDTQNGNKAIKNGMADKEEEIHYHQWDIDFTKLVEGTTDEDLKKMHTYFSQAKPTAENLYTGMFEGYNLIYITAESFSDVIIDKDRTPTLYRMWKEGVQFENFYTPSWYLSTIDGEYVNCLGQIPVDGDWSLAHAAGQSLPMALGNQLKKQGYVCNAYHNHDSYYYDRTKTHPQLGYTFKAVGAGLTFESMYPESDLELMEITSDEYMENAPFHTYYMTMSGHLPYTYGYNSMAVKNKAVTEGMKLSENAACYLEANQELEYAMEYLIDELKQAGQLEQTLFVVAPDHYPYGLKRGAYDELRSATGHVVTADYVFHMDNEMPKENVISVEQDDFELYRNTCLVWSASMEDMEEFPLTVKKCCSNLDLLPTISNLMGLDYDSRMLVGRDVLSEDLGLVMFKDHSFLTDRVRYNATTGEVLWTRGKEDEDYLQQCMQLVEDRFWYSALILQKDYIGGVLEDKN